MGKMGYHEILQVMIKEHLSQSNTEYDLVRIHKRWKSLGKQAQNGRLTGSKY